MALVFYVTAGSYEHFSFLFTLSLVIRLSQSFFLCQTNYRTSQMNQKFAAVENLINSKAHVNYFAKGFQSVVIYTSYLIS